MGKPSGQWVFWLHGIAGLALVVPAVGKVAQGYPQVHPEAGNTLLSPAARSIAESACIIPFPADTVRWVGSRDGLVATVPAIRTLLAGNSLICRCQSHS